VHHPEANPFDEPGWTARPFIGPKGPERRPKDPLPYGVASVVQFPEMRYVVESKKILSARSRVVRVPAECVCNIV